VLFDALYSGRVHASKDERAGPRTTVALDNGDAILIDAYRLHQIERFSGKRDRISATLHAAETSENVWECWF